MNSRSSRVSMKRNSLPAIRSRKLRLEPLEDRRLLSLGLLNVDPVANTHTAPVEVDVSATYDADVNPATATDETFVVHGMQTGKLLDPPNTVGAGGPSVALDPATDFHPGELVHATATAGIESLSGMEAAAFVWQFRSEVTEGSGVFSTTGQILGDASTRSVSLGDLDGDGDLDAFVANSFEYPDTVWLNDGLGGFIDSGQSLANFWSEDAALGDVDGDGDLDAFVAEFPNSKIWLNDGLNTFIDSGQTLANTGPQGVALGDLDGDGDLDALVANTPTSKIWLNDGSGTFIDSSQSLSSEDVRDVALGDVDGDGDLDAFVAHTGGTANSVWLNTAAGFIDSGQSLGVSSSLKVDLGDVDGDGDLDAFVANFNQPDKVWLNDGSGTFSDSGQALGTARSRGVTLGDVDGDGDLDAFVAVSGTGTSPEGNAVWLNDGSGTFIDSGQNLGEGFSYHAQLGDVDGDGDLDAFVGNSGANRVWLNDAVDFGDAPDPTYPTLFGSGGASHVIAPGFWLGEVVDAEADGQPESEAKGEELDGTDDDDGVTFTTELITDETAGIEVFASAAGRLDAWIDFDGDGSWLEAGDQIFANQALAAGSNVLTFSVPATAALGQTFARFRFSSTGGLTFKAPADDGEVEDYSVTIQCPAIDYGDAPDPTYPTLAASLGARHAIVPGFYLGGRVDREPDGQPDTGAAGDDLDGLPDDEDGVDFVTALVRGNTAWIDVRASDDGLLDAWIDFKADGGWAEPGDKIFSSRPLTAGVNRLAIAVPADAELGQTFARFRFSSDGELDYIEFAPDGEVEDYQVVIADLDFGDAPDVPMGPEVTKWTADDPTPEDFFGSGVCVSGDWAIVGATGDDDAVVDSGSAYVFHRDVAGWAPSAKLTAPDPEENEEYGYAVSIFGEWAMVGAYQNDWAGPNAGSIEVYYFDGAAWSFKQKLTAPDGSGQEHFGFSVSVSGEWAVIGAPQDDEVGEDAGAAYVYRLHGPTWEFFEKWTPSLDPTEDRFGRAVSVSGTRALVGAYLDDDGGEDAGAAYVFAWNGLTWTQEAKLTASDAVAGQQLGHSVAISGERAIVGAWLDDEAAADAGAAYVFHREGTNWVQQPKLIASDAEEHDWFGASVSLSGDRAIVGASGDDDHGGNSGSAYVFRWSGSAWLEMPKVTSFDIAESDGFGWPVSISGDCVVVGAMWRNEGGHHEAGSAYVFQLTWSEPTYPTLYVNDGARHISGSGLYLGGGVDIEADGQPHDHALGDDAAGTPDDEDGVTFTDPLVPGFSATVEVEASGIGVLDAWMDFSHGSFMVALTDDENLHNLVLPGVLPGDVMAMRWESSGIGHAGYFDASADFDPTDGTDMHYPNGGKDMVLSLPWRSVTEGGEIHGAKWHDLNGDADWDAGEPSLSDWTIFLDEDGDGLLDAGEPNTLTAINGSYSFTELLPGEYRVAEVLQTYWVQTAPAAEVHLVTLEAGESVEDRDFGNRYEAPAEVGGLVWEDTNGNGVQDPVEPGVEGVTVVLHSLIPGDSFATRLTTTNADGEYHFTGLPAGEYELEFTLPAGYDFTLVDWGLDTEDSDAHPDTGYTDAIVLAAGENQSNWDAGLIPTGTVTVIGDRVWDDVNGNGIQDAGEPGIPDILLSLAVDDGFGPVSVETVVTNADGRYAFVGVDPGEYSIWVYVPGGYTFVPEDQGSDDELDSDIFPSLAHTSTLTVVSGMRDLSWDVGVWMRDYGDAPDPDYPTLSADGGAGHSIQTGVYDAFRRRRRRSLDSNRRIPWHWSRRRPRWSAGC